MHKRDQQSSRISREAAEWCIVMSAGDASRDDKARFAEWITRSPQHMREYAAIEALWEEAAAFGAELRHDERVVSLFPRDYRFSGHSRAKRLMHRFAPVAAVVAVLLFAVALWLTDRAGGLLGDPPGIAYETMKGETRVISLADGSVMHLNTASAATVHYSADRRLIRLARGQGYFEVRKDPERPFVVLARGTEVEALGTAFDVEAFGSELAITVVEGKVVVRERARGERGVGGLLAGSERGSEGTGGNQAGMTWSTNLKANQQIVLAPFSEPAVKPTVPIPVAARAATAWRENKLIFDSDPLSDVVADFNRYNAKRIVVLDQNLGSLRVSGSFDPRDPEAFARTMATVVGLEVETGLEGNIFLRAPAADVTDS